MNQGDLCGHDYGEARPTVHARILGAHVADPVEPEDWIIITPDRDVYMETCSAANPNLTAF